MQRLLKPGEERASPRSAPSVLTFQNPDIEGWGNPSVRLLPRVGAFLDNATGGSVLLRSVGEVPQGRVVNVIPRGLSFRSSLVPQSGLLQTDLGFPAGTEVVMVYKFDLSSGMWDAFVYDPDAPGWGEGEPAVAVAEGFAIDNPNMSTSWTRQFSIWAP